jgi:hypothetical protein
MPYKTFKEIKEVPIHPPNITVVKSWREKFVDNLNSTLENIKNTGPRTVIKLSLLAAVDKDLLFPVVAFFGMSTAIDYYYDYLSKPKPMLR